MLHLPIATTAGHTSFGALLRFLRRQARLTQADLGIAVGYSDGQICRLESGRRLPDLTALAALFLPALGLDPHGDDAQRLLALAALACAESQRPRPRPALRITTALPARPAGDYAALLDDCIALVEEAEQAIADGGDQSSWMARLEHIHDRLRIALGWAQAHADTRGLRLTTAAWRLWYRGGHLREGRRWMEIFLALPAADSSALARSLDVAGLLAWRQGDYAQAEKWYTQALALVRQHPGQPGAARLLMRLGLVYGDQNSLARAQAHYEESLALYRSAGDQRGELSVLHNLGNLACMQNDNQRALAYYEDCLVLYEKSADQSGIALILLGMGSIKRDEGDLAGAAAAFSSSLELSRGLGDDWNTAMALAVLADIATDRRSLTSARRHLEEALRLFEQIGDQQQLAVLYARRGTIEQLDGRHADAVNAFRQGLMLASALGFQLGIAVGLEGLAACIGSRQPGLAARLFAAAAALRTVVGIPVPVAGREPYEAQLARARRRVGAEAWEREWQAGSALTPAEATALALTGVSA